MKASAQALIGALIRPAFRRFLKRLRADPNYPELCWDEDKGLLDSLFIITAGGTPEQLSALNQRVKAWIATYEETE